MYEPTHRDWRGNDPSPRPKRFGGLQVRAAPLRYRQHDCMAGFQKALQALLAYLPSCDKTARQAGRTQKLRVVPGIRAGTAGNDDALVRSKEANPAP
jgi:hypothetical protein